MIRLVILLSKSPTLLTRDYKFQKEATVPYPQHHYNTGCLDQESWGMDRVTDYGS